MQTAVNNDFVSLKDYLAAEEKSATRPEYFGGLVYGRAVETLVHNQSSGNLAAGQHLKGRPCRVCPSDIRANFDLRNNGYYYSPGLVVTCDKRDNDKRFIRRPKLIAQVLSDCTQRMDKREKFFAHTSIASLEECALVAPAAREVTVSRRVTGWKAEKFSAEKSAALLQSLKLKLSLSAI